MKTLLFTITLICISIFSFGQDKIVKRDLTEILCKVSEIGITEIKYKKADNIEGPTYTIKKSEVLKIVFENGSEEKFEVNEMSVVPSANRSYKRAITTRPFSLMSGHICIGYQQALSSSRGIVAEIGVIGPGMGESYNPATGGYGRIGFRLKRSPEIVMEGMEWGYNLGGVYVQPEIAFSAFNRNTTSSEWDPVAQDYIYTAENKSYSSGAFMITVGRQMIFGEIITFDLAGSIGYGFDNNNNNTIWDFDPRYYSHNTFGGGAPVVWNITLTMGIMLK